MSITTTRLCVGRTSAVAVQETRNRASGNIEDLAQRRQR